MGVAMQQVPRATDRRGSLLVRRSIVAAGMQEDAETSSSSGAWQPPDSILEVEPSTGSAPGGQHPPGLTPCAESMPGLIPCASAYPDLNVHSGRDCRPQPGTYCLLLRGDHANSVRIVLHIIPAMLSCR